MKSHYFKNSSLSKLICVFVSVLMLSSCSSCKDDEVPDRDKFFGTFKVEENCDSGNWAYDITITESSSAEDAIILGNFGGYEVNVKGTVEGDSFSLEETVGGATFISTGTIDGTTLSFNYTADDGQNSDSCTGTGTKQ